MELHELHVLEAAAGAERERHALAVVLVAARGAAPPDARVPARAEHHRARQERHPLARVQVERERAETGAVRHEQRRDLVPLQDRNAEGLDARGERTHHRAAGEVAGVAGAPPAVRAEEALVETAVGEPRERAAPVGELLHRGGSLAGEKLHDLRVGEEVALAERVREVLLPRVLGVARAERGVDAAGGEHGVRVPAGALADHVHVGPGLGGGDGGAQAGAAGADDQHVHHLGADAHATGFSHARARIAR
jgi:hypothetical protein